MLYYSYVSGIYFLKVGVREGFRRSVVESVLGVIVRISEVTHLSLLERSLGDSVTELYSSFDPWILLKGGFCCRLFSLSSETGDRRWGPLRGIDGHTTDITHLPPERENHCDKGCASSEENLSWA